ncbi:MAG: hypothetical protein KGD67_06010 [Candidatus Lokiarchaeota archaeon]|nr:hypothetical protein [Candidatus Lokiarchaeota archaeon]
MVLILGTTRFPVSKAKEVSKRYIEISKDFPPDKTLEKLILRLAARIIGDEIESISLSEVKEGKYEEVLKRGMMLQLRFADIEGIKFKNEIFLSGVDALPMVGFEMPE